MRQAKKLTDAERNKNERRNSKILAKSGISRKHMDRQRGMWLTDNWFEVGVGEPMTDGERKELEKFMKRFLHFLKEERRAQRKGVKGNYRRFSPKERKKFKKLSKAIRRIVVKHSRAPRA